MAEQIELKPCPFCGGRAQVVDMKAGRLHIACVACPARIGSTWGDDESVEYLAAAWNRRAPAPAGDDTGDDDDKD